MNKHDKVKYRSRHKIIIVEDDEDLRESLIKYLTMSGYDITGVGSAMKFYQQISTEIYALAIVDIGLLDQNGLVLSEYLKNNTDIRIVMLTARASLEDKLAGYHSGADIYLVKPVDFGEVAAVIDAILIRIDSTPPPSLPDTREQKAIREINVAPWTLVSGEWLLLTPAGIRIQLTAKEFEFLKCLLSYHKQAVSRNLILKALAYSDDTLGGAALETLVHRLRRKTEKHEGHSPIGTIHGVGYSFIADIVIV